MTRLTVIQTKTRFTTIPQEPNVEQAPSETQALTKIRSTKTQISTKVRPTKTN